MPTLYRKYRPQNFSDISGQEHIIQTLTNEIAENGIAHAYLFSGPRGVGKTTVARLLAKAVNCDKRQDKEFEPCDTCSSCQEIAEGKNIDVIEIDAASQTGVDNVRENIIENSRFKPTKSKFKVFIVDEVHMLSTSAFNALLKTLEEPPSHVIFILATTELQKIPATIVSRCQRFAFKAMPYDLMMKRLKKLCKEEDVKVEEDVLKKIINKSDGCLRDAESLLGQVLSLNLKKISTADTALILPSSNIESVLNFIDGVAEKNTAQIMEDISETVSAGINLEQFSHDILEILRLLMMTKNGWHKFNTEYDSETIKKIKLLSEKFSADEIIKFIDLTLKRKKEIRESPLPSLPLELLAVEMTLSHHSEKNETENKTTKEDSIAKPIKKEEQKPSTTFASIKKFTQNLGKKESLNTTMEQIKEKWEEIINNISETNHSLVFVLKMCELKEINNDGLKLTAPFSLHCDKIMDHKNKEIIENNLEKIFSEKIKVTCDVKSEEKNNINDQAIKDLATEFGGEMV